MYTCKHGTQWGQGNGQCQMPLTPARLRHRKLCMLRCAALRRAALPPWHHSRPGWAPLLPELRSHPRPAWHTPGTSPSPFPSLSALPSLRPPPPTNRLGGPASARTCMPPCAIGSGGDAPRRPATPTRLLRRLLERPLAAAAPQLPHQLPQLCQVFQLLAEGRHLPPAWQRTKGARGVGMGEQDGAGQGRRAGTQAGRQGGRQAGRQPSNTHAARGCPSRWPPARSPRRRRAHAPVWCHTLRLLSKPSGPSSRPLMSSKACRAGQGHSEQGAW